MQTDLQYHLFSLTLGGKLFECPAGRDKPILRCLDAGTGTGMWAMDFGACSSVFNPISCIHLFKLTSFLQQLMKTLELMYPCLHLPLEHKYND